MWAWVELLFPKSQFRRIKEGQIASCGKFYNQPTGEGSLTRVGRRSAFLLLKDISFISRILSHETMFLLSWVMERCFIFYIR